MPPAGKAFAPRFALPLLLSALLLVACRPPAPLPRILPPGERVPVVLVPGISGSLLADGRSGETIWGLGQNLVSPYDHGYSLTRSLVGPDFLVPAGVIEDMSLFRVFDKEVYGPVADVLEANGYTRGDVASPAAGGNLYLFDYDWRQDNVASAARLAELLERIAAAHGRREVDLICQSNGAHVCRWTLKYPGLSLEEAEAGKVAQPGFVVRRMVLVGSANGGSLRILRELHRGRSYVPLIGRRIEPEVLFSMPALFQDLPAYTPRPFLDEEGRPLLLELYDASVWRRYGFSIFSDAARARVNRRPDLYGDEETRLRFLAQSLDVARRFHQQLARDLPLGPTRIYSIQNSYERTPHAALLWQRDGRWELLFTDDPALEKMPYATALAAAPGDGHATVESQQFLSPNEKAALAAPPYYVVGPHFELIQDPGALRRLLDFLGS